MKYLAILLIKIYQLTFSPDHGIARIFFPHGCCRYYPTCSEYARQAIEKHGLYGLQLTVLRLSRCHPWSIGGIDPVRSLSSRSNQSFIHYLIAYFVTPPRRGRTSDGAD